MRTFRVAPADVVQNWNAARIYYSLVSARIAARAVSFERPTVRVAVLDHAGMAVFTYLAGRVVPQ